MTFDWSLTIRGLQEAQDMVNRAHAALQPRSAVGRAIQTGTAATHRYAVSVTHVDTGALRASHRQALDLPKLRGIVHLDRSATNPRTGTPVRVYGPIEHARGGRHAFYDRTVAERGQQIARDMADIVREGIP